MQQPQGQDPTVLRFERIEAAHESLAKSVAALASDSHTAFAALNISQQHRMEEVQRIVAQLDKRDTDVHALFKLTGEIGDGTKALLTAQVLMADAQRKTEERMAILADAQAKTEIHMDELAVKSAETQGKLDALIHMWDQMIRERSGKNGAPPEPPPTA